MNTDIVILAALKEECNKIKSPFPIYYTGIGKINAAITTIRICQKYPDLKTIINFGTAGSNNISPGELVDCTKFVQRDMDATALGFPIGQTPYDSIPFILEFNKTKNLIGKQLTCGTGDNFSTNIEYDVVDMEAYSIAKICWIYQINFISYKYITDNGDPNDWKENLSNGIYKFEKLISQYDKNQTN